MDINAFLSADKSMIIAPAGFGKTHTIAEAIAAYNGKKKVLVLTHTHAGIASLKEKFGQFSLPASKYHLDTICSFALDLTKTFHVNKSEIPSERDTSAMFGFALVHAALILRAKPIRKSLSVQYDHLIVDEYQDCTLPQHRMIMELANVLKTHLLGDPLQGIFGFNDPIVDFNDASLSQFHDNCQSLDVPWRWNNTGNEALGQDLLQIREKLIRNEDISLNDYHSIKVLIAPDTDYTQPRSQYKNKVFEALRDNSVLLVHPRSESPAPRVKFVQQFSQLRMIESIDDKVFYDYCDSFDKQYGQDLVSVVVEMMKKLAKASAIDLWFNDRGCLKNKSKAEDKIVRNTIEAAVEPLIEKKSYDGIVKLIESIQALPDVKVYRKEIIRDVCKALKDADKLGLTALDAIERNRNIVRRSGRKISGKGIGTTLLTKGLEFDTVVVLNAHQFNSPKHLYVALTRCCKKLVVITQSTVLHPYV